MSIIHLDALLAESDAKHEFQAWYREARYESPWRATDWLTALYWWCGQREMRPEAITRLQGVLEAGVFTDPMEYLDLDGAA